MTLGEGLFHHIPSVKGIANSVADMTEAFSSKKKRSFEEVAPTGLCSPGRYALVFVVNRIQISWLPAICLIFVFTLPNPSSGHLIMVLDKELSFLDMDTYAALKYIISIGMAGASAQWKEKRSR